MSFGQRRAAEAEMARRDRLERGGRRGQRAAMRSRMPNLLSDDEEDMGDGLIPSGARRRARKTYEERRDIDDMEGVEDVCSLIVSIGLLLSALRSPLLGTSPRATQ